jgi:alcohol dehydrogenase class IV
MMTDIDINCAPRVIIGPITRLGAGTADWAERALLLADSALEATAAAIQEQLDDWGIKTILFAREGLSADTETLDESLSLARGSHAGMIVALGGEKVLSLGRLVAAAAGNRMHADDFMGGGRCEDPGLPVLEIPASGRHTLLFRKEALLTDSSTRRTVLIPLIAPTSETILIDSSLPGRLSAGISALSAASVLACAVEAFLSPRSNFFADVQSRSAVSAAAELLRRVKDEAADPDYRIEEAETAVLSAFSTGLTGPGPGMMLSWAVAAAGRIPKAAAYTVLLPWVLESPLYSGSPKLGDLSRLIADPDEESSGNPAEELRFLFGRLGLPGRLRELGAELGDILPASLWAVEILGSVRSDLDEGTFRDILELSS